MSEPTLPRQIVAYAVLLRRSVLWFSATLLASNLIQSPAATLTVLNVNDTGAGSLRQAINDANNTNGPDTIVFQIPGAGVHTVSLAREFR